MKKLYLITVPSNEQGVAPTMFVTDNLNKVTDEYKNFFVQQIDFKHIDVI